MSNSDNIEPPLIKEVRGSLHPINQVKDYLLNMLREMGFHETPSHVTYLIDSLWLDLLDEVSLLPL